MVGVRVVVVGVVVVVRFGVGSSTLGAVAGRCVGGCVGAGVVDTGPWHSLLQASSVRNLSEIRLFLRKG